MIVAAIPSDEEARCRAVHRCDLSAAGQDGPLTRIASMAARLLDVPIAQISLIDREEQRIVAAHGWPATRLSRRRSFCAHAILKPDVMVLPDAASDARFRRNPLVTDAPGIRFYAAAPLRDPAGYPIGALCVIDTKPRPGLTDDQRAALLDLAHLACGLLIRPPAPVSLTGGRHDHEGDPWVQRRLSEALVDLTRQRSLSEGRFQDTCREVAVKISAVLGVARVGIWLFDDSRIAMEAIYVHDRDSSHPGTGTTFHAVDYPRYFTSLEMGRWLDAADALNDDRTSELAEPYLKPLGIASLLDIPIRVASGVAGVLCIESVGAGREWTWDEQTFAAAAGDLLSLALEARDRVAALALLREAKETAEAANRAKTEFLANMSHELRTPLNAVIGFSEIIASEMFGPSPRYADYARDIHDSATHLLSIISDILDMAKLEARKTRPVEEVFPLWEAVSFSETLMSDRARDAGVDLVMVRPPRSLGFRGDRRMIQQVLLNLLSNAVKFSDPGARVLVEAIGDDDGLVLRVVDQGIGIAEDDIERIQQPFGQVDSFAARAHAGTGLGLSISRGLVGLHDGRLEISSILGEGTTVTVRFPPARIRRIAEVA